MRFQFYWRNWWKWWPYYNRGKVVNFTSYPYYDIYTLTEKVFCLGPFQWRWYSG